MSNIVALFMAAGTSSRMGGPNKLWMEFRGAPLIAHSSATVSKANFIKRLAVTGRDAEATRAFLKNQGFETLYNPEFANGFGSSLGLAFSTLKTSQSDEVHSDSVAGAMVLLADMPLLKVEHLNRMIAVFESHNGQSIVRASGNGHPGNPVIIPAALFGAMAKLSGDKHGKMVLASSGVPLVLVEIGMAAIADLDTPEGFEALERAAP
jgi:molybdenum cofactor cytidylyltransferase